jgi:hypothetical protein
MKVMRTARTAKGFVYVVSATNGYLKVGKASNPFERFSMIQCSSPLILTLAYVCECPNPVDIEVDAHQRLDQYRRHREWFDVSTETAVAAVRAALQSAGIQTEPSPHRAAGIGSPALLRAAISEKAILPADSTRQAPDQQQPAFPS